MAEIGERLDAVRHDAELVDEARLAKCLAEEADVTIVIFDEEKLSRLSPGRAVYPAAARLTVARIDFH